jgi:AcrR family transcriptional regulator
MAPVADTRADPARERVLDAARVWVAENGPRRPNLSDIAARAGVSRPTVYRHFPTREALLLAISNSERERFETELAAATRGRSGAARLDRALQFIVEFQRDNPTRVLVTEEPGFMVQQLTEAQRTMVPPLARLFEELTAAKRGACALQPADLADLVVRIAASHYLIEGSDAQFLQQLRHVVACVDL